MKKYGNWALLIGSVAGAIAANGGFLPAGVSGYAGIIATLAALLAKVPGVHE